MEKEKNIVLKIKLNQKKNIKMVKDLKEKNMMQIIKSYLKVDI